MGSSPLPLLLLLVFPLLLSVGQPGQSQEVPLEEKKETSSIATDYQSTLSPPLEVENKASKTGSLESLDSKKILNLFKARTISIFENISKEKNSNLQKGDNDKNPLNEKISFNVANKFSLHILPPKKKERPFQTFSPSAKFNLLFLKLGNHTVKNRAERSKNVENYFNKYFTPLYFKDKKNELPLESESQSTSESETIYHYQHPGTMYGDNVNPDFRESKVLPKYSQPGEKNNDNYELRAEKTELYPLAGQFEFHSPRFLFDQRERRGPGFSAPPHHGFHPYQPSTNHRGFSNHMGPHFPRNRDRREYGYNFLGSGNFEVMRGGIFGESSSRGNHFHSNRIEFSGGDPSPNFHLDIIDIGSVLGFQGYNNFNSPLYNALSKQQVVTLPERKMNNFADASDFSPTTLDLEAMS